MPLLTNHCPAPVAGRSSGHVLRRLHCRVHGSAGAKCPSGPTKNDTVKKSLTDQNFQEIFSRRDDRPVYKKALTSFVNSKNALTNLQEIVFHKFGKTFILANVFVLAVPKIALAEICEQNNSLFNMPILFAISMIGATVGGASLQRKGKYKDAIKYHFMALNISEKTGEDAGLTEAYGAIADCYTELGELEQAGKFYDKYIARLEKD